MKRQYLSIPQLSAKLGGRSRSSIYRDVEAGRLPAPLRIGGRIYFDEAAVDEALSPLVVGSSTPESQR